MRNIFVKCHFKVYFIKENRFESILNNFAKKPHVSSLSGLDQKLLLWTIPIFVHECTLTVFDK